MVVSGKTKVYGVIGDPIEHSLSPIIQNAAFAASKLDCAFLGFNVKTAEIRNAINGMRALGILGLNVTMPYKKTVINFLDEVDQTAMLLNAVNTIQNKDDKILGFNTDGIGALNALKNNGIDPKGKKIVLLGAGGAARAIAFALAEEAEEFSILNRTMKPAVDLANNLKQKFSNSKVIVYTFSKLAIKANVAAADLLINATSVGMQPNPDQTIVERKWLKPKSTVMDIVYNPVETKLSKDAKAIGAKVISGVEMLIYQGAASFEIWTGHKAPVEVMKDAALKYLQSDKLDG